MPDIKDNADPGERFIVLRNHEEQYSLWQAVIAIPAGWNQMFGPDSKEACLAYVEREWTDMRPLSLRQQMDKHAG